MQRADLARDFMLPVTRRAGADQGLAWSVKSCTGSVGGFSLPMTGDSDFLLPKT
jgi:hypothetical protein